MLKKMNTKVSKKSNRFSMLSSSNNKRKNRKGKPWKLKAQEPEHPRKKAATRFRKNEKNRGVSRFLGMFRMNLVRC